jgi:hypothetical protein
MSGEDLQNAGARPLPERILPLPWRAETLGPSRAYRQIGSQNNSLRKDNLF